MCVKCDNVFTHPPSTEISVIASILLSKPEHRFVGVSRVFTIQAGPPALRRIAVSLPSCLSLEPWLSSCGATVYIFSADTSLSLPLCLLCLFFPLPSFSPSMDNNSTLASELGTQTRRSRNPYYYPKQLKKGRGASVSSTYLTTGFL